MPNSTAEPSTNLGGESAIAEALDKNKEATAEVKRAADDLAVVHAVLDSKIDQGRSDSDVKRAVTETDKVEKRLGDSAEKLERVNETLERELRRAP